MSILTFLLMDAPYEQSRTATAFRLIDAALHSDPSLFAREDSVLEAWRIVDEVLATTADPHPYAAGSHGPPQSHALVAGNGGWHLPSDG